MLYFLKVYKTILISQGGGGEGTGCYNMACPGFVRTNPRIPVGFVLRNVSVYGHVPYDIIVQIDQIKPLSVIK